MRTAFFQWHLCGRRTYRAGGPWALLLPSRPSGYSEGGFWFQEEVVFFSCNPRSACPIQASAQQVGPRIEGLGSSSLELVISLTASRSGLDSSSWDQPASGLSGWTAAEQQDQAIWPTPWCPCAGASWASWCCVRREWMPRLEVAPGFMWFLSRRAFQAAFHWILTTARWGKPYHALCPPSASEDPAARRGQVVCPG